VDAPRVEDPVLVGHEVAEAGGRGPGAVPGRRGRVPAGRGPGRSRGSCPGRPARRPPASGSPAKRSPEGRRRGSGSRPHGPCGRSRRLPGPAAASADAVDGVADRRDLRREMVASTTVARLERRAGEAASIGFQSRYSRMARALRSATPCRSLAKSGRAVPEHAIGHARPRFVQDHGCRPDRGRRLEARDEVARLLRESRAPRVSRWPRRCRCRRGPIRGPASRRGNA